MIFRFINNVFLWLGFLLMYSCADDTPPSVLETRLNLEDSIALLIKKGKTSSDSINYLNQAITMAETIKADSLWFAALDYRSIQLYQKNDYSSFYRDAKKYYARALEVGDTLRQAEGAFKLGSYFLKHNLLDSAFFFFHQASKDYQLLSDSVQAASNLLNMAIIQYYTRDFFGSEETSVEALSFLEGHPKAERVFLGIYNNLGIVTRNMNRYREAIKWYEKSLGLVHTRRERMVVLNNIGASYKYQGLYPEAIEHFKKGLALDSANKHLLLQASLLDNMGHCFLLEQDRSSGEIYALLDKAYRIRTQHSNQLGLLESKLHLSDYFLLAGDHRKAVDFANHALEIARRNEFTSNELRALKKLSEISNDPGWSRALIMKMDDIDRSEKMYKQQFASILYEAEKKEVENRSLRDLNKVQEDTLENQKNWIVLFLIVIGVITLLSILVFRNYRQRQKLHENRILIEKFKAKSEEKHLLSMYLHDDISTDLLVGLQQAEELLKQKDNPAWNEILDLFEKSYEKLRTISQDINVTSFERIPFEKKISNLVNLYAFQSRLSVSVKGLDEIDWNEVAVELRVEIYMIAKEALNNIVKHAKAGLATIEFSLDNSRIRLGITDDGTGFKETESPGIGLMNMQNRIERVRGKLRIETGTGGTSLFIELPKL